jgi:hypothetical protein
VRDHDRDYKRHGTTTLFAALNILDGEVIGDACKPPIRSHRYQTPSCRFPTSKLIHVILHNYGTHKHPKVRQWLARHPNWVFHFTPTSASWLNAVENFFSVITRRRIRRGVFKSITDLQAAINRYLTEHNENPKPFFWIKPAKDILAKIDRLPVPSV